MEGFRIQIDEYGELDYWLIMTEQGHGGGRAGRHVIRFASDNWE